MPVRQSKVHDHEPEVVSEGVRDEVPLARQVLEPDLGLDDFAVPVDYCQSSVFNF